MSSTGLKISLAAAIAAAEEFRALFNPAFYSRWEIAGSVRRQAAQAGDIEHVIIPNWGLVPGNDLWKTPERENLLFHQMDELVTAGQLQKHVDASDRTRWGDRARAAARRGVTHDIFTSNNNAWGSTLAIRTGPPDLSRRLVTGLIRNGLRNWENLVWRCAVCVNGPKCTKDCKKCQGTRLVPMTVMDVPDEQTFFRLAGERYMHPSVRV